MRCVVTVLVLLSLAPGAFAATKEQAEMALTNAIQAEDAAAAAGNRWLPAETALKAAKAALAAGSWDQAVTQASTAKAMAVRALEQSREQDAAWRDAVIR